MVVPQVSHQNWWLLKGSAQIAMGNHAVDTQELSFNSCLELILRDEGNDSYQEGIVEVKQNKASRASKKWYHPDWPDNSENTIEVEYEDRERSHRPRVDSDVMSSFEEQVAEEWPNIPIEDLSFDRKLTLYLKKRHDWLDVLDTGFIIENTTTGEIADMYQQSGGKSRILD